jgi:hypothetical protein
MMTVTSCRWRAALDGLLFAHDPAALGPCADERAVGDGVHEVPSRRKVTAVPAYPMPTCYFSPANHHMAVALDLAVDLDGPRGG